MNKLLIISFDLVREGECESFAIGSLLSSLKSDENYEKKFDVEWQKFNFLK